METYNFEPGQSILLTTNSIFYKNVYESTVLSVDDHFLEISTPYYKGLYVPLNVGFMLNLKINTAYGIYEFETEVVDRDVNGHSVFVKLPSGNTEDCKENNKKTAGCKFVTITSGKGGVGKTSFIINYAITLAKKGKNVALMDADLGMANIDVLLKINPRYNLIDVIDGSRSLEEVIVEAPGGIKLIPGGSGIQELANLTSPQFHRITSGFDYLEKNFEYVLIDTGAGLSKNITNFIYSSDETIIITTPEPHAITDAYSIIKVILDKSKDVSLKLAINKCDTIEEGQIILNRITGVVKNFLGYNIVPFGYILDSKIVSRSIKEQVPLCLAYPGSDVAKNIESMVNTEIGQVTQKGTGNLYGFVSKFKSIFGSRLT